MKLGFVCLLALVFSLSSPSSERHKLGRVLLASARRLGLSGSFQAAGGIGGLLAMTQNGSTSQHFYYDDDGAGNITGLFDTNLNQVAYYLYDPFGNTIFASGPMATVNPYRSFSKELLLNPGVLYFGRRFYDPVLQRFVNQDPIQELGGINMYRFVRNSPLSRIDPWGLEDEDDDLDQRLAIAANGSAFFADYAYDKETRRRHEQIMCEAKQKVKNFFKRAAKEAAIQAAIVVATEGLGLVAEAADLLLAARAARLLEDAAAARALPQGSRLTQEGLEHILERHWFTSGAQGAGKFAEGTTARGLRDMISEAVSRGASRANTLGRPGQIFEYNFGRTIGTGVAGNAASNLRVVVNAAGEVVTAFPY
jgi:RHS repeat-associated protein